MARINPMTGMPEEQAVDPLTGVPLPPAPEAGLTSAEAPPMPVLPAAAPVELGKGGGRGPSPADAIATSRAEAAQTEAAPAAPPTIQIGGPKVDSVSTTREIVSPRVKAAAETMQGAAREAQDASTNVQLAEQQKNEAETRFLQATKDAAKEKAEADARSAKAVLEGRAEAARKLQEQEAAAASQVTAAQKKVDQDFAQTQRNYWSDKPWYYEALAGIAQAASRRNLRIMGEDPNKSGVAATIDAKLAEDRNRRHEQYRRSKEFLEDAKKLPGRAREAYDRKLADLMSQQSAELKLAAADAERLKAVADADPEYIATQQNALLAKSNELAAAAKIKYGQLGLEASQAANPNVKVTSVDVDDSAANQKPAPLASPNETKQVLEANNAAADYERLAAQVEKNADGWADVQSAVKQQRAEDSRNIRIGPVNVGLGSVERIVGSAIPDSVLAARKEAGSRPTVGRDIEDKLRFSPKAQELYREASKVATQTALGYGGVIRDSDRSTAEIEEGLATRSPSEFAASLREKAKRLREQAQAASAQRTFNQPIDKGTP
jgi:hypothetical protein